MSGLVENFLGHVERLPQGSELCVTYAGCHAIKEEIESLRAQLAEYENPGELAETWSELLELLDEHAGGDVRGGILGKVHVLRAQERQRTYPVVGGFVYTKSGAESRMRELEGERDAAREQLAKREAEVREYEWLQQNLPEDWDGDEAPATIIEQGIRCQSERIKELEAEVKAAHRWFVSHLCMEAVDKNHAWHREQLRLRMEARHAAKVELEAEVARLRELIDAAGKPWLALDPGIPWEGAIDSAMEAACGEIKRLREERDAWKRDAEKWLAQLNAAREALTEATGSAADLGIRWKEEVQARALDREAITRWVGTLSLHECTGTPPDLGILRDEMRAHLKAE